METDDSERASFFTPLVNISEISLVNVMITIEFVRMYKQQDNYMLSVFPYFTFTCYDMLLL